MTEECKELIKAAKALARQIRKYDDTMIGMKLLEYQQQEYDDMWEKRQALVKILQRLDIE